MKVSPIFRITLGLLLLTVSLILVADLLGLIPSKNQANLEARKKFSESLSIQIAKASENNQTEIIDILIEQLVSRNEDIISIAVIDPQGKFISEFGNHEKFWEKKLDDRSSIASHIQVPIFKGDKEWGRVQLRFVKLSSEGIQGFLQDDFVLLVLFVVISGFLLFGMFLKRSLRFLDPSTAVPSRVKEAMDIMTEPIIILDQKEQIVFTNIAFTIMADVPSSLLIGKPASQLKWVEKDKTKSLTPNVFPWLKTLVTSETFTEFPLKLMTPKKIQKSLKVNSAPILNALGKVNGVIVTFDDVTIVEQQNQEILRAHKKLKESQSHLVQSEKMAAIGQMVAGVAHEINTPLGYISSSVDMIGGMINTVSDTADELYKKSQVLKTPPLKESDLKSVISGVAKLKQTQLLQDSETLITDAKYGLKQISEIVLNLKNFSRMDRSNNDYFDVNEGLESTLKISGNLIDDNLQINKQFAALPEILCAPSQINQVFLNIIVNAIHATESMGKAGVILLKTTADNKNVYITIKDNGCGMSESVQARVFDAFYTTKPVGDGTGLGLSICKKIIKDHHGSIRVKSKPAEGTEFLIQLPIKALIKEAPIKKM